MMTRGNQSSTSLDYRRQVQPRSGHAWQSWNDLQGAFSFYMNVFIMNVFTINVSIIRSSCKQTLQSQCETSHIIQCLTLLRSPLQVCTSCRVRLDSSEVSTWKDNLLFLSYQVGLKVVLNQLVSLAFIEWEKKPSYRTGYSHLSLLN